MAISRMNMERQLRNMGGIMTLEEPRQGYFLGKIVRKAKKAVKKVVKSPIGKAALLGAGIYGLGGGFGPAGFSKALLKSRTISPFLSGGKLSTIGDIFRVGGEASNPFSALRLLGGAAGLGAVAAPFLMGGDEEEVDEGVDVTGIQPMVADIRNQAKQFYTDPAAAAASGLFFMPQRRFVQDPFLAAEGGLADIPREGYRIGGLSSFGIPGLAIKAGQKAAEMVKAGVGKVKSLFDDADINVSIRDEDVMTDAGLQAQAVGQDVFITPKSAKAIKVLDDLIEEGYDITKSSDGDYTINALDEGALDIIAQRLRLGDKSVDEVMGTLPKSVDEMDEESKMIADALRQRKADGGIMDLGGMEKDYRTGGFVEIGAKERADDVPARLSKNEFVFTADAVRNAGGGDIDEGAKVMQNMMDNLEAGGTISEESQGKENPAQAMFDQAQMLEGRLA